MCLVSLLPSRCWERGQTRTSSLNLFCHWVVWTTSPWWWPCIPVTLAASWKPSMLCSSWTAPCPVTGDITSLSWWENRECGTVKSYSCVFRTMFWQFPVGRVAFFFLMFLRINDLPPTNEPEPHAVCHVCLSVGCFCIKHGSNNNSLIQMQSVRRRMQK